MAIGRVLVAATALGLTRKATRLAISYGSNRKLFGSSILQNQGLSFPLADILTKCYAAELMIHDAAKLIDLGRPFKGETSMAKLFATELAMEAATLAIQVHGGYGVFEDYEVSGLLGEAVARQSGWEHGDNQDGHFGGRGERMIVAARR